MNPSLENLTWHDVPGAQLPDSDITVMCELQGDSEPAWPGYWTGQAWLSIEGLPFAGAVTGWADMPRGRPQPSASIGGPERPAQEVEDGPI